MAIVIKMNRKYCCSLNIICFLFSLVPFCTLCQPPDQSPPPSESPAWQFSLTPGDNLILFAVIVFLAVYYFVSNFVQRYPAAAGADGRPPLHLGRAWAASRMWIPPQHPAGVDRSVVEAFPTFRFSDVRDRRVLAGKSGGGELECAVCLSEFRGEETIRLLPRCSHVFHIGCIDSWLADHSTCPVCRSDLLLNPPAAAAPLHDPAEAVRSVEVAIPVNDDRHTTTTTTTTEASQAAPTPEGGGSRLGGFRLAFWRSNSTGRSTTENFERFTLRLPEEVRTEAALPGETNGGGSGVASEPPDASGSDGSVHRGFHEKQVTPAVKTA